MRGPYFVDHPLYIHTSSASKNVNTEAEEATALKAVTRQRPVKLQEAEKT
jgi:hypothetical protein